MKFQMPYLPKTNDPERDYHGAMRIINEHEDIYVLD